MVTCDRCGKECIPSGCTTGYGVTPDGKKHCFACCADTDRASMIETGRATLYLTQKDFGSTVTNWPGTLSFTVGQIKVSRHNMARKRYDFWFRGPDGKTWRGYQIGDNTQIAHCKRTKG